ncbi:MAG: helix-turn-helix domain-containing protein [Pseudomonadota bacterium]
MSNDEPTTRVKRIRRSPEAARTLLIDGAERLLVRDGIGAVQMRAVAREAGMTDAGVAHHFRNRDGLLTALLDHGAEKVRDALARLAEAWLAEPPDMQRLISMLSSLYASGYSELALELQRSGWRDRGTPLLGPVVDWMIEHNQNPNSSKDDIRSAIASLHMVLALDTLFGDAFRRSAGALKRDAREAQHSWWADQLNALLWTDHG